MRNDPRTARAPSAAPIAPVAVDPLSPRGVALALTEGVRRGWRAADLVAWVRGPLMEGGYLRLSNPSATTVRIREDKAGELDIALDRSLALPQSVESTVRVLVETARARALDALLAMKEPPGDDRFVNASIYVGRVARVSKNGGSRWTAVLTEGDSLSAWLLALFAADVLENRDEYQRTLGICQECGSVSFVPGADRRRCLEHIERHPPTSGVRRASRW